jgi:hypothetical protein
MRRVSTYHELPHPDHHCPVASLLIGLLHTSASKGAGLNKTGFSPLVLRAGGTRLARSGH